MFLFMRGCGDRSLLFLVVPFSYCSERRVVLFYVVVTSSFIVGSRVTSSFVLFRLLTFFMFFVLHYARYDRYLAITCLCCCWNP